MTASPDTPLPPWLEESAFPEAPPARPYGLLAGGEFVDATPDHLAKIIAENGALLVWTPQNPRLVSPLEVESLRPALIARIIKASGEQMKSAALTFAAFAVLTLLTASAGIRTLKFMLLNLLLAGVWPWLQARSQRNHYRNFPEEELPRLIATLRYTAWLSFRPRAWILAFCGSLILLFLCQMVVGLDKSILAAGIVKDAVRHGQYWRLFTGSLLHANIFHILYNVAALYSLGRLIQALAHWSHLAIVFLLAALGGAAASLFLLPTTNSVGASGGIMGLIGFLLFLAYRHNKILPPGFRRSMLFSILIIAAAGIVCYDIIDNAAHACGLITGLLLAPLLTPKRHPLPLPASLTTKTLGILSTVVLAASVATTLFALFHH